MRNGAPAVFAAARCVAWGYAICHMRLYLWNSLLGVNPAGSQEHLVLGNGRCGFIFKVQCLGGALSASSLRAIFCFTYYTEVSAVAFSSRLSVVHLFCVLVDNWWNNEAQLWLAFQISAQLDYQGFSFPCLQPSCTSTDWMWGSLRVWVSSWL